MIRSIIFLLGTYFSGTRGELCENYAPGYVIEDAARCEEAARRLREKESETPTDDRYLPSYGGVKDQTNEPKGCYASIGMNIVVYFNQAQSGIAHNEAAPVCATSKFFINEENNLTESIKIVLSIR